MTRGPHSSACRLRAKPARHAAAGVRPTPRRPSPRCSCRGFTWTRTRPPSRTHPAPISLSMPLALLPRAERTPPPLLASSGHASASTMSNASSSTVLPISETPYTASSPSHERARRGHPNLKLSRAAASTVHLLSSSSPNHMSTTRESPCSTDSQGLALLLHCWSPVHERRHHGRHDELGLTVEDPL